MPKFKDMGFTKQTGTHARTHNKIDPVMKYIMYDGFFDHDVGVEGDSVPEDCFAFRAYGTEFIAKQGELSDTCLLRNAKMREYLSALSQKHKSRIMYVCVTSDGRPCVRNLITERVAEPESFYLNGVDVTMEKGAYDLNDANDREWLTKLTDHFKRQRVMLFSYDKDAIDVNINTSNDDCVGYYPE